MIAVAVLSQPTVLGCSYAELAGLLTVIGAVVAGFRIAWKHLECRHDGCHRHGLYMHGHLRLCELHHPDVPDDGHITAEHIAAVTARLS